MSHLPSPVAACGLPFALLTLTAITACQGPYSADGVCVTQARAQCRFLYQCCAAGERLLVSGSTGASAHATEEECVEELTTAFCASTAVYAEAQAEGRIEWDPGEAEECMRPLIEAAEQCDAQALFEGLNDDCEGSPWVTGLVENGDACFVAAECADEEARCLPEERDDEDTIVVTYQGVCTPPGDEGDACLTDPCRSNLYCDPGSYTCQPKQPNGETCSGGAACESGYCEAGRCTNAKPNGVQCYYDGECQSGYCDTADSGVCKPAPGAPGTDVEYEICLGPEG